MKTTEPSQATRAALKDISRPTKSKSGKTATKSSAKPPTKRAKSGAAYTPLARPVSGPTPLPSEATRPLARASTPPPPPARRVPDALPLWTFLWGAGCRRLHLVADGVPQPGDVVVSSLAELLGVVDDPLTRLAVFQALAIQLETGMLERWLSLGNELEPARLAGELRQDARGLKLDRWLQSVGRKHYAIGLHRIDAVQDLATLPERGGDLPLLWQHIREGVPQQRFRGDRASVEILEAVRTDASLPDVDQTAPPFGGADARGRAPDIARPLIACLRLGLRRLPCGARMLDKLADLQAVLMEPGGREALHALLVSRVLETWVDTLVPGLGARVAAARGLPPEIAVDRAVRSMLGTAVYPVHGIRAASFRELADHAEHMLYAICDDASARARIRDALWGPVALVGVPANVCDAPELQLAAINRRHQASVFSWIALGLSALQLGAHVVRSRDELLAAMASPAGRSAALALAVEGILPMWYRFALGQSLPDALSHGIPAAKFPAFCVAIGEPAPALEVDWDSTVANIPEGGVATFRPTVRNGDPVRATLLDVALVQTPQRGDALAESQIALAPGESRTLDITYSGQLGVSGQIELVISIAHAGAPASQPPVAHQRLSVIAGLPWSIVLLAMAVWTTLGAVALLMLRIVVQPFVADLYRGHMLATIGGPGPAVATFFGCVATLVCLGALRIRYYRQHGQLWPPPTAPTILRWSAIGFAVVMLLVHLGIRTDGGSLLILLGVATILIKLAGRDGTSALIAAGGLCLAPPFGAALIDVVTGVDVVAIAVGHAVDSSAVLIDMIAVGWTVSGAVLGLSFGAALGLRGVRRPWLAELVRFSILAVALIVIGALIAPTSGGH